MQIRLSSLLVVGVLFLLVAGSTSGSGPGEVMSRSSSTAEIDEARLRGVQIAALERVAYSCRWTKSKLAPGATTVVVGVVSPNPFGTKLAEHLEKRKAPGGRTYRVEHLRVKPGEKPASDRLASVHLLFIPEGYGDPTDLADDARKHSVLTVSDHEAAMTKGCAVRFLVENGKLAFDVHVDRLAEAKVRVHPVILKSARRVLGGDRAKVGD